MAERRYNRQPSFADEFSDIKDIVRDLTKVTRSGDTSIGDSGTTSVIDEAGTIVVKLGYLYTESDVNRYGLQVMDAGGVRFEVNQEDGMRHPSLPLNVTPATGGLNLVTGPYYPVTAGALTTYWRARCESVSHKGLLVTCNVGCDAATTGEVRMRTSNGATTSVIACAAGGFTTARFQWLHDFVIGSGPVEIYLDARRTSGAGNVNVYWPTFTLATPRFSNATGVAPFPV